MSVGVCVASKDGIALAMDTRRLVQIGGLEGHFEVASEEARKLFVHDEQVVLATHGQATIGEKTIGGWMEMFEGPKEGGAVAYAKALGEWFSKQMSAATQPRRGDLVRAESLRWPLGFIVAGFDGEVGNVYEVRVRAGDSQVQVLAPSTDNPGVYPFGQVDGIERLLNGIDRKALRQAQVPIAAEDEAKLGLLSYELIIPETLEGAILFAQSLVQVQFLAQEISMRTYASKEFRIRGCGGQIRTATVAGGRAAWGPTVSLATSPNALPSQAAVAPPHEQRSA